MTCSLHGKTSAPIISTRAVRLILCFCVLVLAGCATPPRLGGDFKKGKACLAEGKYDQAISAFTETIRAKPKYTEAYYHRGEAYLAKAQCDLAIADFNRVIEIHPGYVRAYMKRGDAYQQKGQREKAMADYNKTVEMGSRFCETFYSRGRIHADRGEYGSAIEDYTVVLDMNPKHVDAYFHRGLAYIHTFQYMRSISDLSEVLEINPGLSDAYFHRGMASLHNKDYDQAIEDLTFAIRSKPKDAAAYVGRGMAQLMRRLYDGAINDFSRAMATNPGLPVAYLGRGMAHASKGAHSQAISDYNKAVELNPGYAGAYLYRGKALYSIRQYDRAITDYGRSVDLNPRYGEAYQDRGLAYYKQGEYDRSRSDLMNARRLGLEVDLGLFQKISKGAPSSNSSPGFALTNPRECVPYSHDARSDRQKCTPCHSTRDDSWRGGDASGSCVACHGHDDGFNGGNYYGTTTSHASHTEGDAHNRVVGAGACEDCHATSAYPCFNDGSHLSLAGTSKCNGCHSPDGGFDGVGNPTYGAKAVWKSGSHGVDKWCAGCHDSAPAIIQERKAPDVCGDNATYGYYLSAAHGNPVFGAERSGVRASRGECAHCHDQYRRKKGKPHGSLFAKMNATSQTENFCFKCHRGSGSVHTGGVRNNNYSARYGGAKPSFTSIYDAFNPESEGSSHSLPDIASFAFGRNNKTVTDELWSLRDIRNPCEACHNPHVAQKVDYGSGESDKSPISLPSNHNGLWGDDSHERMDTYNYQAPYWHGGNNFEPANDATQDGFNTIDYNKFCTECHNTFNEIWSTNLNRPLRPINWSREGDKHGGRNAAENEDTDFYDLKEPYKETAKQNHYNYVLACTDCHEPHGSSVPYLLRTQVNGKSLKYAGSLDTFYAEHFCAACHLKKSFSAGSPCGTGTHPGSGAKCSRCHHHGPRKMCPKLTAACF